MIKLGLTGSIGMGKSTTAAMFKEAGAAVFDADAAVHTLYAKGGAAVPIIRAVFPDAVKNGMVVRERLAVYLHSDPLHFQVLESFIHPLVGDMRAIAIEKAKAEGLKLIVFDVPLLFETGGDKRVDKTVVVSASAKTQQHRVMSRAGMSKEKFNSILSRQMPDSEKRVRADYIIMTDKGLDFARKQVQTIMTDLLKET